MKCIGGKNVRPPLIDHLFNETRALLIKSLVNDHRIEFDY